MLSANVLGPPVRRYRDDASLQIMPSWVLQMIIHESPFVSNSLYHAVMGRLPSLYGCCSKKQPPPVATTPDWCDYLLSKTVVSTSILKKKIMDRTCHEQFSIILYLFAVTWIVRDIGSREHSGHQNEGNLPGVCGSLVSPAILAVTLCFLLFWKYMEEHE